MVRDTRIRKRPDMVGNNWGFKKGEPSFNKGKKMSEEQKIKISNSCKGRISPTKGKKCSWVSKRNKFKKQREAVSKAHKEGKILLPKGKNHWNWKGGITPLRVKISQSKRYKVWRRSVFERDNYACLRCGCRSGNGKRITLNAHHVIPFKECWLLDFKEMIFDVDNGDTLCVDCHNLTKGDKIG